MAAIAQSRRAPSPTCGRVVRRQQCRSWHSAGSGKITRRPVRESAKPESGGCRPRQRSAPRATHRASLPVRGIGAGQDRGGQQPGVHRPGAGRWPACRPGCRPASGRSTAGCPCRFNAHGIPPARPSTGSGVQAAHMPGRCAAPPAPAMITRKPRSRAPTRRSRASRSGVRCADTIRVSCGTSSAASVCGGMAHASTSRTGCP